MSTLGDELTSTVTELLVHYSRNPHREVKIDDVELVQDAGLQPVIKVAGRDGEVVYLTVTNRLPAKRR